MRKLTGSLNSGTDVECLGTSHLLEGVGWCKWGGVIPLSAPKNGGLHNILQPFLRGHLFLFISISLLQKRNNTEGINKSNIVYYQNDGITNQHNLVFGIPFTRRWKNQLHVLFSITQYHCPLIHCLKS